MYLFAVLVLSFLIGLFLGFVLSFFGMSLLFDMVCILAIAYIIVAVIMTWSDE